MSVRKLTIRSLALVAAVAVAGAPLTAQQDTTRLRRTASQTRINVSKGEVELRVRVDTVHLTRYDTVRVDNTIVRVDTVMVAAPAPAIVLVPPGSWYWSLFAGATSPTGDIDLLYTNGYHAGGAVGWDPRTSWLGARVSASLAQLGREAGRSPTLVGSGTALMWQFAGDLKLKANFGGWSLYTLGGLGFNTYNRMATVDDGDDLVVNPLESDDFRACESDFDDPAEVNCFRLANDDWSTQFSWSFGAGTDFHIGRQDMFLEVRWNPISTHGAYTWYVPISLGVRFF
jgi:hypothetical protein